MIWPCNYKFRQRLSREVLRSFRAWACSLVNDAEKMPKISGRYEGQDRSGEGGVWQRCTLRGCRGLGGWQGRGVD